MFTRSSILWRTSIQRICGLTKREELSRLKQLARPRRRGPRTRCGDGAPELTISTLPPSPPSSRPRSPVGAASSAPQGLPINSAPGAGIPLCGIPPLRRIARVGADLLWRRPLLLSLLGGALFLAVFAAAYDRIPYETFAVRDDGVITLGHAKNWVDYGFIGINPSGPRVEGHSAPVEFFLYAVLYRLFALRYDTYANLQTLAASFLLGALFIRFFRDRLGSALALTAFAAFLLTRMGSFFLWHGSGLENAITHVLFLATAYGLYRFVETGQIRMAWVPVVFLATVSRLDSVFHIAPLLLLFALAWRVSRKSYAGFAFGGLVFALWAAFQGWRYLYFGTWVPNTAAGQDISLQRNLLLLWNGESYYLRYSIRIVHHILLAHGGYLLVLGAPLLALFGGLHTRRPGTAWLLATGLILTSAAALHPFAFGQARLVPSRTTTHLALFTVLAIALLLSALWRRGKLAHRAAGIAVAALCGLYFQGAEALARRPICCSIPNFEPVRLALQRAAREQRLPLPSVATYDIGLLSWHKRFNLFDLDGLGSPILAKLSNGPALPLYLLDYAAPDLVVAHGGWSHRYRYTLFGQPAFQERYAALLPDISTLNHYDHSGTEITVPLQIWFRRAVTRDAKSRERRLIDAMRPAPSVDLLARELVRCRRDTPRRCAYVVRTAYRFRPELVRTGQRAALVALFSSGPTRALDRYLLEGARAGSLRDPALRSVMDTFFAVTRPLLRNDHLVHRGEFAIYAWGTNLIYYKERCSAEDALRRFQLRGIGFPSGSARPDVAATAELRRAAPTAFPLREVGYTWDHRCIAVLPLMAVFPLERQGSLLLETGQLDWNGEIRWQTTLSLHFDGTSSGRPTRSAPDLRAGPAADGVAPPAR